MSQNESKLEIHIPMSEVGQLMNRQVNKILTDVTLRPKAVGRVGVDQGSVYGCAFVLV